MAKSFNLQIISPVEVMYDGEADLAIFRAGSGDIGIMANHEPIITKVGYGEFKIVASGNETNNRILLVFGGFAEFKNNKLTVVADIAEKPEQIDIARAEAAKARAEERIKNKSADIDFNRAELALKRALIRLDAKKK